MANDHYILPDLGVGNDSALADMALNLRFLWSLSDVAYIYPVPPTLNCSGTVSAVQFCYVLSGVLGTEREIFTLLTLGQSGLNFVVSSVIPVSSTPTEQICTSALFLGQFCCDVMLLNSMDQFDLPAANFAFGIISEGSLLAFNTAFFPQFIAEHYRLEDATLAVGDNITVNISQSILTDRALRLVQFSISKFGLGGGGVEGWSGVEW